MNADGEENDSQDAHPVRTARFVLWLALGLLGVSQCLPQSIEDPRPMWYFRDWQSAMAEFLEFTRAGKFEAEWWGHLIAVFGFVSLVGAPFAYHHLVKVPRLLRLLRPVLLMIGAILGYLIYSSRDHLVFGTQLTTTHPNGALSGFWWWLIAMIVNLIGLWLIPTETSPSPEEAPHQNPG
jgi:hypothetical protein